MLPLFSIVTVTRNNCPGLVETARSLQQQTCSDFEWIIIDGASTDGTSDYLKTTNANWISEPDTGLYDAMNKGIARTIGDYVLFLNAGDKLAFPNTLARLQNFIKAEKKPPALIYGDSLEGGAYKPARAATHIKFGMFTHHQSILYKKSSLQNEPYDTRYKIAADYDLTARIMLRYKNALHYPLPICIFEQGGLSQTSAQKGRHEQFLIRRRLKITRLHENAAIYALQTAVWTARRFAPGLYWRVKSSGNMRRGSAQT
ncbi:MAG: glycosyltransferase family 2 protein [Alphaproteobacteria bacterium]